jgi:hypothetical protein
MSFVRHLVFETKFLAYVQLILLIFLAIISFIYKESAMEMCQNYCNGTYKTEIYKSDGIDCSCFIKPLTWNYIYDFNWTNG